MKNDNLSDIILYTGPSGQMKVEVFLHGDTAWLTQKRMAEVFDVDRTVITKHLRNIFEEGELSEDSVCANFAHTAGDGKSYKTRYYNLDAIISVGYRVNSEKATKFRIWATKVLKEYMIKGFALDDGRLKEGGSRGTAYFTELLERIRDIRTSERMFYQKITDIYAQCSIDYDPNSGITHEFYATAQNKLHWAIHHRTAAELIKERADAGKPNMGLTNWKNSPHGKIRKSDVDIAKNYLNAKELKELNRIVTMYLDYAEHQADKGRIMTMKDWIDKLDSFLKFNEHDVLTNPGKVSAEVAKELAEKEFDKYEEKARLTEALQPVSDFDKLVEKTNYTKPSSRPSPRGRRGKTAK